MTSAPPARPALTASLLLTCAAALFLALTVASSTLDAGWTPLGALLPLVALVAGLFAVLLAQLKRTPELGWTSGFGLASAPAAAAGALALELRLTPWAAGTGTDQAVAFGLYTAAWAASFLLAWWALRVLTPLPGLLPAGALVAANVLNRPEHQMPYAFAFLAGVILLLLASNHARLQELASWLPAQGRVRSGRLWSAGAVLGAGSLLAAAVVPPASSVDLTSAWHPPALHGLFGGAGGPGAGGPGAEIGFSPTAGLFGPLTEGKPVTVFTYSPGATAPVPLYFRAIDLPAAAGGSWNAAPARRPSGLAAGAQVSAAETPTGGQALGVQVTYVSPISSPPGLLVYPGLLSSVDRAVSIYSQGAGQGGPVTLDRVQSRVLGGTYNVQVSLPDATVSQLESAGTGYPAWVQPYRGGAGSYTADGYRDPGVLAQVAALARQVTAGASNPYDQATAVESYLRSSAFTYTLTPPRVPAGTDPLAYFLFQGRQGFCQYFAVAMGDMLRSLGIPTRLVNGFGPGKYDSGTGRYTVTTSDAHSWVEAYFPGYGWIPFEPTPDGVYSPIPRAPDPTAAPATTENPATAPAPAPAAGGGAAASLAGVGRGVARVAGSPSSDLLLLLALLALAAASRRLLRPRTVAAVWRRLRWLSARAGVGQLRAETPLEFAARLAARFPQLREVILGLGEDVSRACYSPPGGAAAVAPSVRASWRKLQPVLVRAAARRTLGRRA